MYKKASVLVPYSLMLAFMSNFLPVNASVFTHLNGVKELWPYFRIRCDLKCAYGYLTDIEGNYICRCYDACKNIMCFGRTRCALQLPKVCLTNDCRPTAYCRDSPRTTSSQTSFNPMSDAIQVNSQPTLTISVTCLQSRPSNNKCRHLHTRWFFDDASKLCKPFWGCKTDYGNNFMDEKRCVRHCQGRSINGNKRSLTTHSFHRDANTFQSRYNVSVQKKLRRRQKRHSCQEPVDFTVTQCKGVRKRWFFDKSIKSCKPFHTCERLGNNYKRKRQCRRLCIRDRTKHSIERVDGAKFRHGSPLFDIEY